MGFQWSETSPNSLKYNYYDHCSNYSSGYGPTKGYIDIPNHIIFAVDSIISHLLDSIFLIKHSCYIRLSWPALDSRLNEKDWKDWCPRDRDLSGNRTGLFPFWSHFPRGPQQGVFGCSSDWCAPGIWGPRVGTAIVICCPLLRRPCPFRLRI